LQSALVVQELVKFIALSRTDAVIALPALPAPHEYIFHGCDDVSRCVIESALIKFYDR
jgi:hypothetical protein